MLLARKCPPKKPHSLQEDYQLLQEWLPFLQANFLLSQSLQDPRLEEMTAARSLYVLAKLAVGGITVPLQGIDKIGTFSCFPGIWAPSFSKVGFW